jgi:hypothetical protein
VVHGAAWRAEPACKGRSRAREQARHGRQVAVEQLALEAGADDAALEKKGEQLALGAKRVGETIVVRSQWESDLRIIIHT